MPARSPEVIISLNFWTLSLLATEQKAANVEGTGKNGKSETTGEDIMDLPKIFEEIKKLEPVHVQIKNKKYPVGEIFEYLPGKDDTTTANRMTSAEKKELDASYEDMYQDLRRAAESHRQTRKYIKSWIKPGMRMFDIWRVCLSKCP